MMNFQDYFLGLNHTFSFFFFIIRLNPYLFFLFFLKLFGSPVHFIGFCIHSIGFMATHWLTGNCQIELKARRGFPESASSLEFYSNFTKSNFHNRLTFIFELKTASRSSEKSSRVYRNLPVAWCLWKVK